MHGLKRTVGKHLWPIHACTCDKTLTENVPFVCCYVGDVLAIGDPGPCAEFVTKLDIKTNPTDGFKIRNYGILSSLLGMEIKRTGHKVKISQTEYIKKMGKICGVTGPDFPASHSSPGRQIVKSTNTGRVLRLSMQLNSDRTLASSCMLHT